MIEIVQIEDTNFDVIPLILDRIAESIQMQFPVGPVRVYLSVCISSLPRLYGSMISYKRWLDRNVIYMKSIDYENFHCHIYWFDRNREKNTPASNPNSMIPFSFSFFHFVNIKQYKYKFYAIYTYIYFFLILNEK